MKINFDDILSKFTPVVTMVKRYAGFSVVLGFLFIYSLLVLRINLLMGSEPNDIDYNDRLKTVQRPKIDENILDKIKNLQDQNVSVQTLFKQARDDPFSE